MANSRRHRRVPLPSAAVLKIKGSEGLRPLQTLTADISFSGIGLYSYDVTDVGSGASVEINFIGIDGLSRRDRVDGQVVYASKIEGINKMEGLYFTGIQFDEEINPLGQPFLYDRLQEILKWD
jgi:c-di-GMP-binding flagellar brake protein YcgR